MILFLLAAMASAEPAAAPRVQLLPPSRPGAWRLTLCNSRLTRTDQSGRVIVRPRKLGELPPGRAILAVDRRVEGCPFNVLPARDEHGQHRMEWAPGGGVSPVPVGR